MPWSEEAWKASESIYNAILDLPFIKELADGTLSRERFLHYIGRTTCISTTTAACSPT